MLALWLIVPRCEYRNCILLLTLFLTSRRLVSMCHPFVLTSYAWAYIVGHIRFHQYWFLGVKVYQDWCGSQGFLRLLEYLLLLLSPFPVVMFFLLGELIKSFGDSAKPFYESLVKVTESCEAVYISCRSCGLLLEYSLLLTGSALTPSELMINLKYSVSSLWNSHLLGLSFIPALYIVSITFLICLLCCPRSCKYMRISSR